MSLYASGSQTVGPYLHIGLTWLNTARIAGAGAKGERVSLQGRLVDGDASGVSDGLIDLAGERRGQVRPSRGPANKALESGFRGSVASRPMRREISAYHRQARPRAGPRRQLQAPHLSVTVFMRGLLKQLSTRISSRANLPTRRIRC